MKNLYSLTRALLSIAVAISDRSPRRRCICLATRARPLDCRRVAIASSGLAMLWIVRDLAPDTTGAGCLQADRRGRLRGAHSLDPGTRQPDRAAPGDQRYDRRLRCVRPRGDRGDGRRASQQVLPAYPAWRTSWRAAAGRKHHQRRHRQHRNPYQAIRAPDLRVGGQRGFDRFRPGQWRDGNERDRGKSPRRRIIHPRTHKLDWLGVRTGGYQHAIGRVGDGDACLECKRGRRRHSAFRGDSRTRRRTRGRRRRQR